MSIAKTTVAKVATSAVKSEKKSVTEKFTLTIPITVTRDGIISMGKLADELTALLRSELFTIATEVGLARLRTVQVGCCKFTRVLPASKPKAPATKLEASKVD